jgi:uncharacterized coiled-coil protein SlyX
MDEERGSDMSGGFGVQEEAIQTAIGHLTALFNEVQTNNDKITQLQHIRQPGGAKETAAFQTKATASAASLLTEHQSFLSSIQTQIDKLQTTLKRYQAGEDAAKYGFGN